jgi:hypothetical protein
LNLAPPPSAQNPPKNTINNARIAAPKLDPLHLRANHSQMCENYSDLFLRNAKITATNHYRFAQFLARTLKESRNSERTFQRFRATPASHSATKNVILSEPLIRWQGTRLLSTTSRVEFVQLTPASARAEFARLSPRLIKLNLYS